MAHEPKHKHGFVGATRRAQLAAERARRPLGRLAFALVSTLRRCTRTACGEPAVATLTYMYAQSTAVVGPLATYAEPHCYDLCARHSARLTAPRGWEIVRLEVTEPAGPTPDDLEALADAVREAAKPAPPAPSSDLGAPSVGRRGHLRVLLPPQS
jgi:hypothetical protein